LDGPPLSPRLPWKGRRVVLGVTGGIAAYKTVQLARDLALAGAIVETVMTEASRSFVGPTSFQGVTGRPVHASWFDGGGDGAALHLRLGSEADAVMVAPATADFISRAACGAAEDLLTATLLATRAPVLLAPAMNSRMYDHPQTRLNLDHCRDALGYRIIGPATGRLGAGEGEGIGRMVEPGLLLAHVGRALQGRSPLQGLHVLITAGPTYEPVDPVRVLANRSSGRMGFALAREAWMRGARVTLVAGPVALPDPEGVDVVRVESAREMHAAVLSATGKADVSIFTAAVSDFRPRHESAGKVKKETFRQEPSIALTENPDIARESAVGRKKGALSVGFALETENLAENARAKLHDKGLDLIVGNDPDGFGGEASKVVLIDREGEEALPLLEKSEVASRILDRVSRMLEAKNGLPKGEPGV
jgi:phosphopantothenoylcysteine decarboxylase / phosphopantothenate---cysteine ligase